MLLMSDIFPNQTDQNSNEIQEKNSDIGNEDDYLGDYEGKFLNY